MNRKFWVILTIIAIFLTSCNGSGEETVNSPKKNNNEQSVNKTEEKGNSFEGEPDNAFEIVEDMGTGWNMGCSLDSFTVEGVEAGEAATANLTDEEKVAYYETLWGNVQADQELIDTVKNAGFDAIRVPVTYVNHMNDGVIDKEWLARVAEVVDCVLEADMYCIINVHHDTGEYGWITAEAEHVKCNVDNLSGIWSQVAEYFKDYDEKLLFEGFNEILNDEQKWSYAGADSYNAVNQLNQSFVDTVRKTGGNNAERYLVVNTYAANSEDDMISAFKLPTDTVCEKLIAQVHCYKVENLEYIFSQLKVNFIDKNVPLILGEFGMNGSVDTDTRVQYVNKIKSIADNMGIACFWWDDGGNVNSSEQVYNYALLNRSTLEWYFPEIVEALTE